jgi:FkbM family methyltransferase
LESRSESSTIFTARLPIAMEVPDDMLHSVREVLEGEYEAGCFGENLTILDLGANVGSFSLWAYMRWPGSTIHSYEPHPGTFAILRRNIGSLSGIHPVNAAVFPTEATTLAFAGRYDGDGESGIAEVLASTFNEVGNVQSFEVAAVHPRNLPAADVIKIDVEGAEFDILSNLDVSSAELIVMEYQNDAIRAAVKGLFAEEFDVLFEDEFLWDELLAAEPGYRASLAGDHWGRLFFIRRELRKLRRLSPPRSTLSEAEPDDLDTDANDRDVFDDDLAAAPTDVPVRAPPPHRSLLERGVRKLRRIVKRLLPIRQ